VIQHTTYTHLSGLPRYLYRCSGLFIHFRKTRICFYLGPDYVLVQRPFLVEVCGNSSLIPIPSNSHDFFHILIPFPSTSVCTVCSLQSALIMC